MKLELCDRWDQTHCLTAKVRYATRREAKFALKRLKRDPSKTVKTLYRCKHCRGFHLTSKYGYGQRGSTLKDFDLDL